MKKQNGITLIALVITIIVLLILAGVSISMVTGDNGIATKAELAKTETDRANEKEEQDLQDALDYIDENDPANAEGNNGGGTENVVYELSGIWCMNEQLNIQDYYNDGGHGQFIEYINFTANGQQCNAMDGSWHLGGTDLLFYGYINDYNDSTVYMDGWEAEICRYVDFGNTPQAVSKEFYEWFTVNATQK